MCIFTGSVEGVAKTKIFCGLVTPSTQITVYKNQVTLEKDRNGAISDEMASHLIKQKNNYGFSAWSSYSHFSNFQELTSYAPSIPLSPVAMVLPVPTGDGDVSQIKMVDMTKNKDIFDKLSYATRPESITYSAFGSKGMDSLEIKRCGPYSYSVVPDVSSFEHLSKKRHATDKFQISPHIPELLKKHYPTGFAFLVCIIDDSAEYSPVAYVHPSDGKTLFVPTLHDRGHGETVMTNDWDHQIYTIDSDPETKTRDHRFMHSTIETARTVPKFDDFPLNSMDWKNLKSRQISGYNCNSDLLVSV